MTIDDGRSRFHPGRVAAGFVVLALGAMLLLDQHHWFGGDLLQYTGGVALVALGLARLTGTLSSRRGRTRGLTGGMWLVFLGVWLIASQAHWLGLTFRTSWPLLLIAWGVLIVVRELFPQASGRGPGRPAGVQEN